MDWDREDKKVTDGWIGKTDWTDWEEEKVMDNQEEMDWMDG
ncbi:hypothetical protein [Paenibacillus thiaminolyticus]|nr:hypothetical protein [Paenibacillus thiaminolyticus]